MRTEKVFLSTFCDMSIESIKEAWTRFSNRPDVANYHGKNVEEFKLSEDAEGFRNILEPVATKLFRELRDSPTVSSEMFRISIQVSMPQSTKFFYANIEGFLSNPPSSKLEIHSVYSSIDPRPFSAWQRFPSHERIRLEGFTVRSPVAQIPVFLGFDTPENLQWFAESLKPFVGFQPNLSPKKVFAYMNGVLLEQNIPEQNILTWKTPVGDVRCPVYGVRSPEDILRLVAFGQEQEFLGRFGISAGNIDFSDSVFRGKVLRKVLTFGEKVLE